MRFHLAGFPVYVHPSFFIVAVLLGFRRGDIRLILIWVAVVFVSILAHELGHALVGRAYGLSPEISLYSMGGLTSWRFGRALTRVQSILVSLAGPGAGFLVGAIVWGFSRLDAVPLTPLGQYVVFDLLWVNFGWGILNLLPLLPLDGGNVMRSVVHIVRGRPDERLPRQISISAGGVLFVLALMNGMMFAGLMAAFLAYSNYQALQGHPPHIPGMGR